MRRILLASTALLALAGPARAEQITGAAAGPVRTSTVKAGTPDAIVITATGSVTVATGTAVIMDSNHAVSNAGDIKVTGADGAIGLQALGGTSGAITNTGAILVEEDYTPGDSDNDGDKDGPFALASHRFGIRTEGAHNGTITQNGTISVEGNDSGGVWIPGLLTGDFVHNGTTKVIGDRSVAVRLDAVDGDVRLAGTVTAQGEDAVAAQFAGDIDGRLEVQGTITATGYRYTTPPADTSKLDADDLLQGGTALLIEGNVTDGIVLARPPASSTSDPDTDDDGIPDAQEGTAKVTSYGAAPAMLIASAGHDIAIGSLPGNSYSYGLRIEGEILGSGLYAGVDGTGLQIGGLGHAVMITNGIGNFGKIAAASKDSDATALLLGDGAHVPLLRNAGTIEAKGGGDAGDKTYAVFIADGAELPMITNSGTIGAGSQGQHGDAAAIVDKSGSVTLVENSGAITASGASSGTASYIAIDLAANTSGATIHQTAVGAGTAAPKIVGDVLFGSGDDTLFLQDGSLTGNAYLGGGANFLSMSGDAVLTGDVHFGAGADVVDIRNTTRLTGDLNFGGGADILRISGSANFRGEISNAAGLAVSLHGGVLDLAGKAMLASLDVSQDAVLGVTLDKDAGEGTFYDISGTASFEDGALIGVRLGDFSNAQGHYVILKAGTLDVEDEIEIATGFMPFVYKASLADNAAANTIAIDITVRTKAELGLNDSQASALDAILAAVSEDEEVEQAFFGISNGDQFRSTVSQMLPDHAGGTFEGVSLGLRTMARQVSDVASPVYSFGGIDVLVTSAVWSSKKDLGASAAYDLGGVGLSGAVEIDNEAGTFGLSLTGIFNDFDQGSDRNQTHSDIYEMALYWRENWDKLSAFGRVSYGFGDFGGTRSFSAPVDGEAVERTAQSDWGGAVVTGMAGIAYEGGGRNLFFRPNVVVDYARLSEGDYVSSGGGDALDLVVDERTSDELAVNAGLALGIDFSGNGYRDRYWFRIETDGGWREVVGGSLGSTTAHFTDGESFTLDPEQNGSGWYMRLRAAGGGDLFDLGGEIGAEDRHGNTALSLRGTLRIGF